VTCVYCINSSGHPDNLGMGKCKLFGNKNLVTGNIEFDYAYTSRIYAYDCGMDAKNFKQK
jgi:hypothetical protein